MLRRRRAALHFYYLAHRAVRTPIARPDLYFGGSVLVAERERETQLSRVSSLPSAFTETLTHPAIVLPGIIWCAPGSASQCAVSAGGTRTIRSSRETPATRCPRSIKPIPPNIRFSVALGSSFRRRVASP